MNNKNNILDNIITEVINSYVESKSKRNMLKEYKNPEDSETIRVCADQLEALYNNIIKNGMSKREITVKTLGEIIKELRALEMEMR